MESMSRLKAIVVVSALAFMACSGQTVSLPASPTVQDPAIKNYQTMVGIDEQRIVTFLQGECDSPDSSLCPDEIAKVIAELHQWLDDLNRSEPPARFASIDVQMRRDLALAIADLNALGAAYKAKDQNGMNTALAAAGSDRDKVEREANAVTSSS
jgi:hypothetical protein